MVIIIISINTIMYIILYIFFAHKSGKSPTGLSNKYTHPSEISSEEDRGVGMTFYIGGQN